METANTEWGLPQNSDDDHLYALSKDGGRGLNSITYVFITRIITLAKHNCNK